MLGASARVAGLRILSPTGAAGLLSHVAGPSRPMQLLVANAYGVFRSTDGGTVVYTDSGRWLVRSADFGRTWVRLSDAVPDWTADPGLGSTALAQSPSEPSVLYASVESSVRAVDGALGESA